MSNTDWTHGRAIQVYISHGKGDEKLRDELCQQLAVFGDRIEVRHRGDVVPGDDEESRAEEFLDSAHVALLLLTQTFFTSREEEIQRLLERDGSGKVRIFLIQVEPFHYQSTALAGFPLLSGDQPISRNRKQGWAGVAERLSPFLTPLRWLHLSELGLDKAVPWESRPALKALVEQARSWALEGRGPQMVFITGDLTRSGSREDFKEAQSFLCCLGEILGLDLKKDVFIVPGDQDVAQGALGPVHREASGKDRRWVREVMEDPELMAYLAKPLEAFYDFAERLGSNGRGWNRARPWRVDARHWAGVDVAIVQLNSVWLSSSATDAGQSVGGELRVGDLQVAETLDDASGCGLRIGLVHHSSEHLRSEEWEPSAKKLGGHGGLHFFLHGHPRLRGSRVGNSLGSATIDMAAGSPSPTGELQRHQLVELDLVTGLGRARFFRFVDEAWVGDFGAHPSANADGVWEFELPRNLHRQLPEGMDLLWVREERARLVDRYRRSVGRTYNAAFFAGFAERLPRRVPKLSQLFVPLRLQTIEPQTATGGELFAAGGRGKSTAEFARSLLAPGEVGERFVLLGDPGTGKSTLCQFLAILAAGSAELHGFESTEEPLPFLVRLRDVLREESQEEGGFVDRIAHLVHSRLEPVPRQFLVEALTQRRALLLFDGFDEVGSVEERLRIWDLIRDLGEANPRLSMVITSRLAGYEEVMLPFKHLYLTPFERPQIEAFVRNWYALQAQRDPRMVLRHRELIDVFEARPRLRELARNPLLATLIALVHRYQAQLPGERVEVYDLCVKTLLVTWPAVRGKRFEEIDPGLQRTYLEALAFRMQQARSWGDREVVIRAHRLVETLTEIVWEHQGGDPTEVAALVRRWVGYLEEGTGILVQMEPGVYAFVHLALMEYLAAAWMTQEEGWVDGIASYFRDHAWREVCLLAVGLRSRYKGSLDRLFDHWSKTDPQGRRTENGLVVQHWIFLLAALVEEATFSGERRETILRKAAVEAVDGDWRWAVRLFGTLWDFSMRHRAWLRDWYGKELEQAEGRTLEGLILIRGCNESSVLKSLNRRPDAEEAAVSLLDFGPRTPVGAWARRTAPLALLRDWAWSEAEDEVLPWQGIAAFSPAYGPLAAALVPALVRSADAWCARTRAWCQGLEDRSRPGGQGLPEEIFTEDPHRMPVGLRGVGPFTPWPEQRLLTTEAARDLARNKAIKLAIEFSALFREPRLIGEFLVESARYSTRNLPRDLARQLAVGFDGFFGGQFARQLAQSPIMRFDRGPVKKFVFGFSDRTMAGMEPPNGRSSEDLKARDLALSAMTPGRVEPWLRRLFTLLGRDAWIAMATTYSLPEEQRIAYLTRRLQNTWLLHVWPVIDKYLRDSKTPDHQALYLALGFFQATTTWQWPGTASWSTVLGQRPAHWLPRALFHLCWLLYEPKDEGHRKSLVRALLEGSSDAQRPGVAEKLMAVCPVDSVLV